MSERRARYSALLGLELRRTLSPGVVVTTIALCVLLMTRDWTPAALAAGGDASGPISRGLLRQATWTGCLALVVLAMVLRATRVIPGWRSGEGDWLGSRPIRASRTLLAAWGGGVLGSGALLLAVLGLLEARADDGHRALELAWSHSLGDYQRLEPGSSMSLEVSPPAGALGPGTLSVALRPSPGADPTSDARVSVQRGTQEASMQARVGAPTRLEVTLPGGGSGPLIVAISNTGGGALAIETPDTLQLWNRPGGEWRGSLAVLCRSALAIAALTALGLGFSAWMSWGTSCALTLSLVLGTATAPPEVGRWLPGAGLAQALSIVGQGRVPALPGSTEALLTLATVAAGLGLARPALRVWRGSA